MKRKVIVIILFILVMFVIVFSARKESSKEDKVQENQDEIVNVKIVENDGKYDIYNIDTGELIVEGIDELGVEMYEENANYSLDPRIDIEF